jgi:hypothetical protein
MGDPDEKTILGSGTPMYTSGLKYFNMECYHENFYSWQKMPELME